MLELASIELWKSIFKSRLTNYLFSFRLLFISTLFHDYFMSSRSQAFLVIVNNVDSSFIDGYWLLELSGQKVNVARTNTLILSNQNLKSHVVLPVVRLLHTKAATAWHFVTYLTT